MQKGVVNWTNTASIDLNQCSNVITGESKHGILIIVKNNLACPYVSFYALANFLKQNKIIAGIVLIVIGFFLMILGVKFIKFTIFITGMISVTALLFFIVFGIFIRDGADTTTVFIVLGVGVVLGIILGWFLIKMTTAFFIIVGGYLGFVIGQFLYNLVLYKIHSNPQVS